MLVVVVEGNVVTKVFVVVLVKGPVAKVMIFVYEPGYAVVVFKDVRNLRRRCLDLLVFCIAFSMESRCCF